MSVYIIAEEGTDYIKIGHSENIRRRREVLQMGNPSSLYVLRVYDGGSEVECWLHRKLKEYRKRGEWFDYGHAIVRALDAFENDEDSDIDVPKYCGLRHLRLIMARAEGWEVLFDGTEKKYA